MVDQARGLELLRNWVSEPHTEHAWERISEALVQALDDGVLDVALEYLGEHARDDAALRSVVPGWWVAALTGEGEADVLDLTGRRLTDAEVRLLGERRAFEGLRELRVVNALWDDLDDGAQGEATGVGRPLVRLMRALDEVKVGLLKSVETLELQADFGAMKLRAYYGASPDFDALDEALVADLDAMTALIDRCPKLKTLIVSGTPAAMVGFDTALWSYWGEALGEPRALERLVLRRLRVVWGSRSYSRESMRAALKSKAIWAGGWVDSEDMPGWREWAFERSSPAQARRMSDMRSFMASVRQCVVPKTLVVDDEVALFADSDDERPFLVFNHDGNARYWSSAE